MKKINCEKSNPLFYTDSYENDSIAFVFIELLRLKALVNKYKKYPASYFKGNLLVFTQCKDTSSFPYSDSEVLH